MSGQHTDFRFNASALPFQTSSGSSPSKRTTSARDETIASSPPKHQANASLHPADKSAPNCPLCITLEHPLTCCIASKLTCAPCAEFHAVHLRALDDLAHVTQLQITDLNTQIDSLKTHPAIQTQEKNDHIHSLRQQYQDVDAQDKALGRVLDQRKQSKRSLEAQVAALERKVHGTVQFVMKPAKAKRSAKGKAGKTGAADAVQGTGSS
ncbi:hypothetical protein ACN47E_001879 [Coniothyrium glycines]